MALTQTDKAEAYDRIKDKARVEKAKAAAMTLRAVEFGTGAIAFAGLAALEEAKPEWFTYEIPRVVAAVGGLGMFMFAGKSDMLREVGAGLTMAGAFPLVALGAKKAVAAAQAA